MNRIDIDLNRRMMIDLVKEQVLLQGYIDNNDLLFETCFRIFWIEEVLLRLGDSKSDDILKFHETINDIEEKFLKFLENMKKRVFDDIKRNNRSDNENKYRKNA